VPKPLPKSQALFDQARRLIPGGVNSPARAFGAVGGTPPFIARARGSHLWDVDGNEYIDYVLSWGPLVLGHAHPTVVRAVQDAAERGTSYGAPTEGEVELAGLIVEAMPSLEMVRFVNSGTEATMSALRLARAATGRDKIIKFAGCYHGHADGLLVQAGSGATTLGIPTSPGVPQDFAQHTLVAPYNNLPGVERLFAAYPKQIAAIIVEPVAANMGVVAPAPSFLQGLRQLTRAHGALLIFDEVVTGFRLGLGGAQARYGVSPDLTCLGKIIGGGLPVGAYGGRRELMEQLAPTGPVYQAGTLSGNPLAMAAGIATLRALREPGVYTALESLAAGLEQGLKHAAQRQGVPVQVNRVGSMLTLFFTKAPVIDYDSAREADTKRFAAYFHAMLEAGIYLPCSQFEALFLSLAHTEEEVATTVRVAEQALARLP